MNSYKSTAPHTTHLFPSPIHISSLKVHPNSGSLFIGEGVVREAQQNGGLPNGAVPDEQQLQLVFVW
jgi:hypothetical protein